MKQRTYILALILLVAFSAVFTAEARPRMVVNIVVGGLRQSDLSRYEKNFSKDGFLRLRDNGVAYTECYADYAPTTSQAGLATLATGTIPATHGIFSSVLFDRTANKEERLTYLPQSDRTEVVKKGIETNRTVQSFIAPTLSEAVINSSERNRVVTIAHNSLSAMIMSGRKGECYWLDDKGTWSSANCYMSELPSWVTTCNNNDMNKVFATDTWYGRYTKECVYNNLELACIESSTVAILLPYRAHTTIRSEHNNDILLRRNLRIQECQELAQCSIERIEHILILD